MLEPHIFYRRLETFKCAKKCLARAKVAYMLGDGKALASAMFNYMEIKEYHNVICFLAYLLEG